MKGTFSARVNTLLLQTEDTATSESALQTTAGGKVFEKMMKEEWTFHSLLQNLHTKLSGDAARNLSVPIAFVCLLHLANEKVFVLEACLTLVIRISNLNYTGQLKGKVVLVFITMVGFYGKSSGRKVFLGGGWDGGIPLVNE